MGHNPQPGSPPGRFALIPGHDDAQPANYLVLDFLFHDGIRLQPANPEMEPIMLKNEEVQVLGVVTGVLRAFDS